LLPALGEEIFFRGFLSRGLVGNHGVIWGSLIASIFFAVVHVAPVQVCGVFILGLGMQYVFLTTRSLLAPIVLHMLNNSIAFVLMRHGDDFRVEGITDDVVENALPEVAHASWPLVCAAIAATAAICWVLYLSRTRWILPKGDEWSPGYFATESPPKELSARAVTAWPGILPVLVLVVAFGLFVAAFVFSAD
jgi:hypothetical protein